MFERFLKFYLNSDKIIFYSAALAITFALLITLSFTLTYQKLPKNIPLFYSLPWGQPEIAKPSELLILPAIVLLITLINITLSWHLHSSQLILKRILNLSSVLTSLLILITALKIISIFI